MTNFSTVCFNSYGMPFVSKKTRFKLIVDSLLEVNADAVFLQEVWLPPQRQFLISILKNRYDFFPKKYLPLNNNGLLTFIKKDISAKEIIIKRFTDQGPLNLICIPDRIGGKGFQAIEVELNSKKVLLINCHTLCQYNRDKSIVASYHNQINELVTYLLDSKSKHVILSGDLNDDPDSKSIIKLKKECVLHEKLSLAENTVNPKNLNRGAIMNIFGNGQPYRTDYTLVSKDLLLKNQKVIFDEIVDFEGVKHNLSDHYGVYSEIVI